MSAAQRPTGACPKAEGGTRQRQAPARIASAAASLGKGDTASGALMGPVGVGRLRLSASL